MMQRRGFMGYMGSVGDATSVAYVNKKMKDYATEVASPRERQYLNSIISGEVV